MSDDDSGKVGRSGRPDDPRSRGAASADLDAQTGAQPAPTPAPGKRTLVEAQQSQQSLGSAPAAPSARPTTNTTTDGSPGADPWKRVPYLDRVRATRTADERTDAKDRSGHTRRGEGSPSASASNETAGGVPPRSEAPAQAGASIESSPTASAPSPAAANVAKAPDSSSEPAAVDTRKQEYEKWRQERSARNDDADAYLALNEADFMAAIVERFATIEPPTDAAVQWVGTNLGPHVREALLGALGGRDLSRVLAEFLHPGDPRYLIDRHRPLAEGTAGKVVDGKPPIGQLFWRADIGFATALEAELRLRESLTRMIPRYAAQVDAKHPAKVTIADLVTSHPMDRVAARIFCDERIVKPVAPQRGKKKGAKTGAGREFRDGIRYLSNYRWMGAENPTMWNWIEVTEPRDATPEDVAATLWLSAEQSQRAYAIVGSPPFFKIPPQWAEQFDTAKEHRPRDTQNDDASESNSALDLAESAYATDVAIAQAAPDRKFDKRGLPLAPDHKKLPQLLDQSWRQLERVRDHLKADGLWELVLPALSWVGKHREHVLSIPDHRLIALTPVIEGQQALLFEAVGAVAELAKMQASDPSGSVTAVMRDYAIAIGESHLLTPARTQLEKAKAAKAELPLRLLDQSAHDTRNSIETQRGNETNHSLGADAASKHVGALQQQIGDMRARRAAGGAIDPDDALLVSAELKEEAVLSRAKSIFLHLDNLSTLGSAATAAEIQGVAAELKLTIIDRHPLAKATKVAGIDPRFKRDIADATTAATSLTDDALTAFLAKAKLDTKIPEWIETIEARERKLRAFQIASMVMLLVGTAMAGNFAGGVVAAAVRGTLLADAATAAVGVTWGVRIANATGAVAGLATDAAINAGVQVGVSGGSLSDGFADNMLANAAMRVALAPLHKATAAWGGSGKEIANLGIWERNILRGKTLLKGSAVLTAEMITAAAVNYVVHRARHGAPPDEATAMEWAIQGASMAIGKFMGRWTHDFEARITGLVERGAHLRARAANMRKLAAKVEETGDKDEAMKLLVERHDALEEEAKIVHELAATGKLSAQTAETMTAGNQADRSAVAGESFKTMPLRLQGLQPDDASGTVWTGARDDISIALHQAEKSGLEVRVLAHDTAARQWRIRLGGDELTIIETKPVADKPADADSGASAKNAKADKRADEARAFMEEKWAALRPPTSVDEVRARRGEGERWSDQQVRDHYNARNKEIGDLNEQWKEQGLSPAVRAAKASELRHEMRMVGREMMSSDKQRLGLLVRDALKYGDGGGPKFEQLVESQHARGLEGDAAYEAIISGAQRTDAATNARVAEGPAKEPDIELPQGTTVYGDKVTLTDMSGKQLVVYIKRTSGSGIESHRNKDGTFEVQVGDKARPDVALKQVSQELGNMAMTPRQSSDDLPSLYEQAAIAQKHLGDLTRGLADELGGTALVPEKLKGQDRTKQKVDADYEGEVGRITDLARSTIVFETPQQIQEAMARIRERAEVVRVKDRFAKPSGGYRDVMMNLRMPNGHIVEIQLHLRAILEVKNGPGHALYEQRRSIDARIKQEGRGPTPAEEAEMKRLETEMAEQYESAYNSSLKPSESAGGKKPTEGE